jgi:hypothetical protein
MSEISAVIGLTQRWIEKVIIGLNFCPFAKREFERRSIRYQIHSKPDVESALSAFLDELSYLDEHENVATTLLIFEQGFIDFEEYLQLAGMASALIEQSGYGGLYQLATFHPHYCFDGEQASDPANYTNRAPFPILHILREASIERVLRSYPSPESIPTNNIAKARAIGVAELRELLL